MSFVSQSFAYVTHYNAAEYHTWEFRRFLDKSPINVAGASQILLELRNPNGVNVPPLPASPLTPGADWTKGIVVVLVDAAVTAFIGTWSASIAVYLAGETVVRTGTIEVQDRPGVYAL